MRKANLFLVFLPSIFPLLPLLASPALSQNNSAAALPSLQSQEAVLDTSPPEATRRLNGGVSQTEKNSDGTNLSGRGASINIGPGGVIIDGQVTGTRNGVTLDGDQLQKLLQGLQTNKTVSPFIFNFGTSMRSGPTGLSFGSHRPAMTTDQFRQLEHGVIGLDARVHPDTVYPLITNLYPTCPAAEAGIHPGDLLVKANDHVFKVGDGQAILWKVVGGKAGTPVDITVLRDGQELTFHLIRMNIEDIKDDRIRQNYEFILGAFGPPGETTDK